MTRLFTIIMVTTTTTDVVDCLSRHLQVVSVVPTQYEHRRPTGSLSSVIAVGQVFYQEAVLMLLSSCLAILHWLE